MVKAEALHFFNSQESPLKIISIDGIPGEVDEIGISQFSIVR